MSSETSKQPTEGGDATGTRVRAPAAQPEPTTVAPPAVEPHAPAAEAAARAIAAPPRPPLPKRPFPPRARLPRAGEAGRPPSAALEESVRPHPTRAGEDATERSVETDGDVSAERRASLDPSPPGDGSAVRAPPRDGDDDDDAVERAATGRAAAPRASLAAEALPETEPPPPLDPLGSQETLREVSAPRSEPPPRMASIPSDLTGAPPAAIAQFGRFEILGGVATGGMADILLARESSEGSSRHTIIKIVRGEHSENGQFAQMFLDEGRLAMRLSHPNICTVYECGHVDARYFIAMEYVHGKTLRDVLVRSVKAKEPLPIPIILRIFSGVAEALDFAHRARDAQGRPLEIVHRDVSPQNVVIRYDGVVKLLDFGVAKATTQIHESESGALKGKFAYMSPEQAESRDIDARSDVFSLGVMLFEAITGRRLFQRKNQFSTLKALLEADPPPLAQYRPDVPEGLQAIVDRALAKDRDERYARAADLQHDLEKLLTRLGRVVTAAHVADLMTDLFGDSAHQPLSLDVSAELAARFAPLPPHHTIEPTVPAVPRRSAVPWFAAAAVALTLVGVGLGFALAPSAEAPQPPAARVEPLAAPSVPAAPRV
ncbi:MAG: protein kinase, partial [Sandaracinaceae bacterium]|nr:protein kinase [Sandaracinaceae bacterium]